MQTIKTGLVIALLLAVCYGAFVALNAPDPELPESVSEWVSEDQSIEELVGGDFGAQVESGMEGAVAVSPEELMASLNQPTAPADSGAEQPQSVQVGGGDLPAWEEMDEADLPTAPSIDVPSVELPSLGEPDSPSATNMDNVTLPGDLASTAASGSAESESEFPPLPGQLVSAENSDVGLISATATMPTNVTTVSSVNTAMPVGPTTVSTQSASQSEASSAQFQVPVKPFAQARAEALRQAESGKLREALEMLSGYYGSPELTYEETTDLFDLMDALSREVIYSTRHLLEPPYRVKPLDTVASVAESYSISPELLNAINGLGDSKSLVPGSKLKVVRGPFRAVVSLSANELAVFLGPLYAGRFPISLGQDPAPQPGEYSVVARQRDRTYYARTGVAIPAGDPRNPYGDVWLSLGELSIHGAPEMVTSATSQSGCISLAPIDARDVFKILTVGSQVEIRP